MQKQQQQKHFTGLIIAAATIWMKTKGCLCTIANLLTLLNVHGSMEHATHTNKQTKHTHTLYWREAIDHSIPNTAQLLD